MRRQTLHRTMIRSRSPAVISRKKSLLEVWQSRPGKLSRTNRLLKLRQTSVSAQQPAPRLIARQISIKSRPAVALLSNQSLKWPIKLLRLSLRLPGYLWCQVMPSRTLTRMMTRLMRALHCPWLADAAKPSRQAFPNLPSIISSPKDNTYKSPPRRSLRRASTAQALLEREE